MSESELNDIKPAFETNNVPICFSSDNNYISYLGVAIKSLIENSSPENNYDIFILDDKITDSNKALIYQLNENKSNISIRFIDILPYLGNLNKSIFSINAHFSIATYYRFFIPSIFKFFDKMLYLDSDIVVLADIAALYKTDLEDNILAAVKDVEMIRSINAEKNRKPKLTNYMKKTLKIKKVFDYFQAGVLVFNVKKMIEENIQQKLIDRLIQIETPMFVDQCILNSLCQGKVKFVDYSWNVEYHVPIYSPNYVDQLPLTIYNAYNNSRNKPNIVHYSGGIKPWQDPEWELSNYFWEYARLTPFYEQIFYKNIKPDTSGDKINNKVNQKKLLFKYIKYDVLSSITFGELKRHYKRKRKAVKFEIMK